MSEALKDVKRRLENLEGMTIATGEELVRLEGEIKGLGTTHNGLIKSLQDWQGALELSYEALEGLAKAALESGVQAVTVSLPALEARLDALEKKQ